MSKYPILGGEGFRRNIEPLEKDKGGCQTPGLHASATALNPPRRPLL